MAQRRNKRSGVEALWIKTDGTPSARHGRGKRWRARYVDAAGKEHTRAFTTKVRAQQWVDGIAADMKTGTYVDPSRSSATFATVAAGWMENPSWTPSTRARYESIMAAHVLPKWGAWKLNEIEHEPLQDWVNELVREGMAAGTVRKVVGVANGVLKLAVRTKRLSVNPAEQLALPRQRLKKRRFLSAAEVRAFAEAAGDNAAIVQVLAFCGLRFGELSALRVGSVDLIRCRLMIEESCTEVNGVLTFSEPKDHQRRSVPYPSFLQDDLKERTRGRNLEAPLFESGGGAFLRYRNVRRDWFDAAARKVGLDGLTPHELRHTAASLAISAGATPLGVQRMLGHDKPSTTLDVYSDLFDADLDDVADRLSEQWTKATAYPLRTGAADTPAVAKAKSRWPGLLQAPPRRFERPTPALGERCSIP